MAMEASSIPACDACGAKRGRWFCAADAAYLCHARDTSIHAANSVACRHNRVKLSTRSAVRYGGLLVGRETSWPLKKTRSERRHNFTLAPSLNREMESGCTGNQGEGEDSSIGPHPQLFLNSKSDLLPLQVENLNLASFIGTGSHGNNYNDDNCEESNPIGDGEATFSCLFERVKIEENEDGHARVDAEAEAEAEAEELFDLNIDLFDSTATLEEGEKSCYVNEEERKISLSLNYEDVLSAWSDRGSPWADHNVTRVTAHGMVPNLNLRTGRCVEQTEQVPVMAAHFHREKKYNSCGVREAGVMRYREKRRNRLFSKSDTMFVNSTQKNDRG